MSILLPFPLLGVAHRFQVLLDFLHLLVLACRNLEPVDCLKQVDLFVQSLLEGSLTLLLCQGLVVLDFLQFSHSPNLQLLIQDLKVLLGFGVPSSLDFLTVSHLLIFSQFFFLFYFALDFIVFLLAETIGQLSSKPPSCESLYVKGGLVSALLPHIRVKIKIGQHIFVSSCIDPQAFLFHLGADLSLDFGRLGHPFVGLRLSGVAQLMIGFLLVSLGEGVPMLHISIHVSVSAEEGLLLVDADDLHHLHPLVSDVSLFVTLDYRRLDVVEVVDSVGEFGIGGEDHLARLKHLLVAHRSYIISLKYHRWK
jgi:hypothetical protein